MALGDLSQSLQIAHQVYPQTESVINLDVLRSAVGKLDESILFHSVLGGSSYVYLVNYFHPEFGKSRLGFLSFPEYENSGDVVLPEQKTSFILDGLDVVEVFGADITSKIPERDKR